jgi:hypothetical protein
MTYPSVNELKVERIDQTNENEFVQFLYRLSKDYNDKNRDWFNPNLPWSLINRYKDYEKWYITKFKNEIIAFSGVIKIQGYYRLVSRMYNCLRKKGLIDPVKKDEISPAMLMLEKQLEDYPTNKLFISMEYLNRRKLLEELATKINLLYGGDWKLNDGVYLTCNNKESFSCWQSTISIIELPFEKMSIQDYTKKFSNKRKRYR